MKTKPITKEQIKTEIQKLIMCVESEKYEYERMLIDNEICAETWPEIDMAKLGKSGRALAIFAIGSTDYTLRKLCELTHKL